MSPMDHLSGPLSSDARRSEDMQALMTLYDLPIYAGTDNAAGAYQAAECDAEQLRAILTATMREPKETAITPGGRL